MRAYCGNWYKRGGQRKKKLLKSCHDVIHFVKLFGFSLRMVHFPSPFLSVPFCRDCDEENREEIEYPFIHMYSAMGSWHSFIWKVKGDCVRENLSEFRRRYFSLEIGSFFCINLWLLKLMFSLRYFAHPIYVSGSNRTTFCPAQWIIPFLKG